MKIGELLDQKGRETFTIGVNETLSTVFSTLAQNKIGALVVMDPNGQVAGIISERDLVRAVAQEGEKVLAWPITSVMTSEVVTARESETINNVMEKMTAGRFRHLPVIENNELTGVLSIGDVVKHRIQQIEREAEDIRAYIHAV